MLKALEFAQEWIQLLMLCVSSVRYTIQANGKGVGTVCPTRGIRQGDPLSSYLFIICAEGLSILLQQAEGCGDIHGIARGAPSISHLFFADDSLLFFKANQRKAQKVKECLEKYSGASGQLINFDKFCAVFSHNTTADHWRLVSACVGVRELADFGKYLGLPSVLGRNKNATFHYIEARIRERMGNWQHKFLSKAGKEVLLKSVAQALPIFTMSVFLLPTRTCDSIERLFNRYWWGGNGLNARGIHWLSWARMCLPKDRGGLGFKRLHHFNVALLAKQGWRLMVHPESLVARLLKAKYFPHCEFLDASLGRNPSSIWRSILVGQQILRKGAARRISNGADTNLWDWSWLANVTNPSLITPVIEELQDAMVSGLLTSQGDWDTELLAYIFYTGDVRRIIATPTAVHIPDSWRWVGVWVT
ncbi:PREDICTED: uncharacterized protein LOC109175386 [Ipomoea nil]|uniref:uncharacterized protein LOC109175386 n=1 Tax=Ipomoea nil TaxID=35883 RepID=UPI000901FDE6|nr:PREDICTED: uncharacterized protein LOC109175386 [Ipomoea nil]